MTTVETTTKTNMFAKKEVQYKVFTFPYTFKTKNWVLKPSVNGIYLPENEEQKAYLELQRKRGLIWTVADAEAQDDKERQAFIAMEEATEKAEKVHK